MRIFFLMLMLTQICFSTDSSKIEELESLTRQIAALSQEASPNDTAAIRQVRRILKALKENNLDNLYEIYSTIHQPIMQHPLTRATIAYIRKWHPEVLEALNLRPTSFGASASMEEFPGEKEAMATSLAGALAYEGRGDYHVFPTNRILTIGAIHYEEYQVGGDDNQCGFFALGTNRQEATVLLKENLDNPIVAQVVALDIWKVLRDAGGLELIPRIADADQELRLTRFLAANDERGFMHYCAGNNLILRNFIDTTIGQPGYRLYVDGINGDGGVAIGIMDAIAALKGYKLEVFRESGDDGSELRPYHIVDAMGLGLGAGLVSRKLILRGAHFNILDEIHMD